MSTILRPGIFGDIDLMIDSSLDATIYFPLAEDLNDIKGYPFNTNTFTNYEFRDIQINGKIKKALYANNAGASYTSFWCASTNIGDIQDSPYSLSFWFKTASEKSGQNGILSTYIYDDGSYPDGGLRIWMDAGKIKFDARYSDSSAYFIYESSINYNDNKSHNFSFSQDIDYSPEPNRHIFKFYMDGALILDTSIVNPYFQSSWLTLFAFYDGTGGPTYTWNIEGASMDGMIADLRIYDRILDASEMIEIYTYK